MRTTKSVQEGQGQLTRWRKPLPRGTTGRGRILTGKSLNWYASAASPSKSDEYGIRIDQNFSANTRIYGRWMNKHESKNGESDYYGASDVAGPGDVNPDNRYSAALGLSQVFSSTFVMNANVEYSRWIEGNIVQSGGFKDSTLGLAPILDSYSPSFQRSVSPPATTCHWDQPRASA